NLLLVQTDAKMEEGGPRLIAQGISALDEAVLRAQRGEVHIYLDGDDELPELQNVMTGAKSKSGMQGVQVKVFAAVNDNERVVVQLPDQYLLSPSLMATLESLDGVARVEEV
ncbi:MAG: hypothetical protein ACPG80_04115, partial [Rickettsiales bacterium]